jgi:protoporphyrinogen oxidase
VGAAYQLTRLGRAAVTLLEQQPTVDISSLLGDDLACRERHGRIRLRGRWLHFPLKPTDLLLHLDRRFAIGAARDMFGRFLRKSPAGKETFASVLESRLGPTICRVFYFPYSEKIWGRDPADLSAIQARRRVSAGTFAKLVGRVFGSRGSHFYYPRRGYGQISEAYADAARAQGADLRLGWRVSRVRRMADGWEVEATSGAETITVPADYVWSTIPLTVLARICEPPPPKEVLTAADAIEYRAMTLVYLFLDEDQFRTTDAHYFPETSVRMTRLSEPKNYFGLREPAGRTVLCAEIPCAVGDETWKMSAEDLSDLVSRDLARVDLPLPREPYKALVRRLPQAYPIYLQGYETPFATLDNWAESHSSLLTFGRQGLFAHDNTHHALYMAYCAVDSLGEAGFDHSKWADYREIFSTHVVED